MKKLVAGISISTTLALSVFAVPAIAFGSTTSMGGSGNYSNSSYNTDTMNGTTTNGMLNGTMNGTTNGMLNGTTNSLTDGKKVTPSTNSTLNTYSRPNMNNTTTPNKTDPYGSYYNSSNTTGRYENPSVSPRMRTYGIESTTPNTNSYTNYGTRSFDTMHSNLYKAKAAATTTTGSKSNWGWLGLLGLIGLAGLRSRDRDRETS